MKKRPFVTTLLLTGFCFLPLSSGEAATWEHAVIETDHTFTITFSDNVEPNQQLIKNITIFAEDDTVAYTPAIKGLTMTLDPNVDLQPSESYTVEVELTTGESYKREFFTKAVAETPVTQFIEKYPTYKDAELLSVMQEQLQQVAALQAEGTAPDASLQAAVDAIPKQLQALEKIVANAKSFETIAAKKVETATANEFDVAMMSESLSALIHTHLETAPSIDVLTALQQTWTNASSLVTAAEKANEAGLELFTSLEDVNNAIADFIVATPFPTQAASAKLVKDLQKSFDTNITNITATESKVNIQIAAIEKLVDTAFDYTFAADDAKYIIADIQAYQAQFKSFENASAITNGPATYKQFQAAINTISSKLTSSTSTADLEDTVARAEAAALTASTALPTLIDAYLEREVTKLVESLEAVEQEADQKDIHYITLDSYFAASQIIYTLEMNYTYYDEVMTWSEIQQAFKEADAAVKAVRDELKKM